MLAGVEMSGLDGSQTDGQSFDTDCRLIVISRLQIVRECIIEEIRRRYGRLDLRHASCSESATGLSPGPNDLLIVDASHSDSDLGVHSLRAAFPTTPIILLMLDGVANIGIADTVKLPPSLDALLFMVGAACGLHGPKPDEPEPGEPAASRGVADSAWDLLTPREREVAHGVLGGKANKLIAAELGLSDNTVKMHLTQIMRKLKVTNRTQVVLMLGSNQGHPYPPKPPGQAAQPPRQRLGHQLQRSLTLGPASDKGRNSGTAAA